MQNFLLQNNQKENNDKIDKKALHDNLINKQKIYSIIPLNVFQTWHSLDLPIKMKENIDLLKKTNPEFKYHLYNDDMCREFILKYYKKDVLYTFDKLKPGAFKADLWRYCILYKYGGIYLDLKFKCENGFKLLELTDKEYFIKDVKAFDKYDGIYQAILSCFPKNKILFKAIYDTVNNCKDNIYTNSTLGICGPGLLANYFETNDINNLQLVNTGDSIIDTANNNQVIFTQFKEYRKEQNNNKKTDHYSGLWFKKDVYNYPLLQSKHKIDFSKKISKTILGKNIELFSGTPTIIEYLPNIYIINLRWINYNYNNAGNKNIIPSQWISMNSRFKVDENFNKISEEYFLDEDFNKQADFISTGLEDIRVFNYNGKFYYTATVFDNKRKIPSISSNVYTINDTYYKLQSHIILPKMYNLNTVKVSEKNWSFFNYKNKLCVVYKYFPLQIGEIDYKKNKLDIIEIKYDIPSYFEDARGSTCGITKDNFIWFVLHKAQSYTFENKKYYNYQHFFAVFDLDMNLIRYSELFKLGDCKVEFCTGLIVKDNEIILSYSLLDTQSIISVYDMEYIDKNIKWYKHK